MISDAHENITNISSTFNGNITDRDILLGDWSNEVLPHFIDLFLTYVSQLATYFKTNFINTMI